MQGVRDTVLAALFLAAVSTFGDFLWAALALPHRVGYGIIHGAALCLCIGAAIGVRNARPLPGAVAGPIIGIVAASSFYLLAPAMRWRAMLPAWMLFWICFAFLQGWLSHQRKISASLVRGVAAAGLSGIAFYAIADIWTRPSPGGPDYLRHFFSWTLAFLPGFAALFLGQPSRRVTPPVNSVVL